MLRSPTVPTVLTLLAGLLLAGCGARAADTPQPAPRPTTAPEKTATPPAPDGVNPDAHAQKAFLDRLSQYTLVRAKVERALPKLPDQAEPHQIDGHKKALREGLRAARADAKPGDLFQPETAALIRQLLADASKRHGPASREAIDEENPGQRRVTINGEYPEGQPVATVPPEVLAALPRLPDEEVEFRFMGKRLVLLDTRARMIIDYMENALP
jgi:hypothetical protein